MLKIPLSKNLSWKWKSLIVALFVVLIYFAILFVNLLFIKTDPKSRLESVLEFQRNWLRTYHEKFKEFPILFDGNVNFWDSQTSEFVWQLKLHSIPNVATSSEGERVKKNHSWSYRDPKDGVYRKPSESLPPEFLNPITGKFDWLAEDASGTLYSQSTPGSVLMASPPIRVVNIRCPLTASDPPFFEDLTKW